MIHRHWIWVVLAWGCWGCGLGDRQPPAAGAALADEAFWVVPQHQGHWENGVRHGTLLKAQIEGQLGDWETAMKKNLGVGPDSLHRLVFHHAGFYKAIAQHTPGLLDEIKGIGHGAGVAWERVLAFNLGEELYCYLNQPVARCSNLAMASGQRHTLVYNQDLPLFLHGDNRPVALAHGGYYAFGVPGSIGMSGVSTTAAISCNSLPMLHMDPEGLPLSFALRKLLTLPDLGAIDRFLRQTPLAVPQNLLVATASGFLDLELSRHQQVAYAPARQPVFMAHTNFPLANTDYKATGYAPAPCPRFHYLDSIVRHTPIGVGYTPETLMAMMEEDHPNTPVHNAQTYLRYMAVFGKTGGQPPHLVLANPQKDNATITLEFK